MCGPCRTRLLIKGRACAKASKSSYGVLKGLTVRSVVGAGGDGWELSLTGANHKEPRGSSYKLGFLF